MEFRAPQYLIVRLEAAFRSTLITVTLLIPLSKTEEMIFQNKFININAQTLALGITLLPITTISYLNHQHQVMTCCFCALNEVVIAMWID